MSLRITIIVLLLSPCALLAQVVSQDGRFSVAFDRGCAPLEVTVTETSDLADLLIPFGGIATTPIQYFYGEGNG